MYGVGDSQVPNNVWASSLETDPEMITFSPRRQFTGVETLCFDVSRPTPRRHNWNNLIAVADNEQTERVITHHSAITVRRSVGEVARYVFDPTTMPQWSAVVYAVEEPTETTFRVGSRLKANMHVLGVSLPIEGEMVELDEAGMRALLRVGPIGADGLLEHELVVEDVGDASVIHFRNRVTLPGWLPPEAVSDELVRHLLDQTAAFALANIKYILENDSESRIRDFMALAGRHLVPALDL